MRRRLATTILASFLIGASLLPSQAAVKTGSNCPQLNKTSVSGGLTFTCIKSGKKLVWSKGVKGGKATPAPAPATTPVTEGSKCSKMGVQVTNDAGLFECRYIVGNQLVYKHLNNSLTPISNPTSPDPVSACRLGDMRTTKNFPWPSIAYPAVPGRGFEVSGTFKVVVLGIDFPDAQGTGTPDEMWKDDLKMASDWLAWYTNGKIKYEFVTNNKWLRMPKNWATYLPNSNGQQGGNTVGASGLTNNDISTEIVKIAESSTDLSKATAFWIYQPSSIIKVSKAENSSQWINRDTTAQSSIYGTISAIMISIGPDTLVSMRSRWAYFLHEMLHSHGLFGHSSKTPARTGIMSPADGWTNVLLPWDSLIGAWDKPGDIYCVDRANLVSTDLTLVPLEREQDGLRAGVIRLNDHQALIVESHRKDKYGVGVSPGTAAVMVNLVDTTVNTTFDNPEGWANPSSTGNYLKVNGAQHGQHAPIGAPLYMPAGWGNNPSAKSLWDGIGIVDGVGINGDYTNWDLNYFMYPGESITYGGIKISLTQGGDNDTVKIERA